MGNANLAFQLSGPTAQNTINTVQAQYELSDPMIEYWYGLSIETASDEDLASIGYLVGYPWPSAPAGTFDPNSFILGSSSSYPESSTVGLSGVGLLSGGLLASDSPVGGGKIPAPAYRQLLIAFAYLKWNGITWKSIDKIVASFGNLDYTYQSGNYFALGSSTDYPQVDNVHGLSGVGIESGGFLGSTDPNYDSDIWITYNTPISLSSLWVIQSLFDSVCTAPKVFVRNGA